MSNTPNLDMPLLSTGQAQKETTHNQALVILDAIHGGVVSRTTTTPPAATSSGNAYIVASGSTGVWSGHDDEIAYDFGSVWNFIDSAAGQGLPLYVQDDDNYVRWNGSAWEVIAFAGNIDAANVTYSPADPSGWGSPTPDNVGEALDTLSGRLETVEGLTASDLQGTGLDADAAGFRGVPQNSQGGNYTTVAADAGKHLYHASGAGAGHTYTIDSNANVAYEIGTTITFVNMDSNAVTIAITSDTLYLAGTGTTGSRQLAQYGVATAIKLTSTTWMISGTGLT